MTGGILAGAGLNLLLPQTEQEGCDWATPTRDRSAPCQVHPSPEQQRRDSDDTRIQTPASPSGINRIPSSFSDISPDIPPASSRSRSSGSRLTRSCSSARWRSSAGVPHWAAPRASVPSLRAGFRVVRSGSCVRAWEGGGGRATRRSRSRRPSRRRRTDLERPA